MTFDDLANMVRAKTISLESAFCLQAMMMHPDTLITKARVAGYLGCSRDSVKRYWRELREAGLLSGEGCENAPGEDSPPAVSLVGYLSKREPTKRLGGQDLPPAPELTPDESVLFDYYEKHLAPLGIQRAARELLLRWVRERHMDATVILEAVDVTTKAECYGSKLSYLDGVLRNWYARGWNAYELWQEGMARMSRGSKVM
jgi:DnaD/phage-associated family protein